jgi:hypothetical protein
VNRRRRLLAFTVLAVLVVAAPTVLIALVAGRGSASFGDEELLGRNRLTSATLDIAARPATTALRAENLAPGDVVAGAIELINDGSIPLAYSVRVDGAVADDLAPWITWWFALRDASGDCPTGPAWADVPDDERIEVAGDTFAEVGTVALVGDPTPGADPGDRVLAVAESELLCVGAGLPLGVPNTAQAASALLTFRVDAEQHVAVAP